MSRLFQLVKTMRASYGPWMDRGINDVLYEILYRLPAYRDWLFFNSGYLPMLPGRQQGPPFDREPLQANLYEFASRHLVGEEEHRPSRILEIGCGRGGGLLYLSRAFPGAAITGVDANRAAVRQARRLNKAEPRISVRAGKGDRTGLPDAAFDFLVSVGTMTYVGFGPFLAEAARVTRPGSLLAVTGGTTGPTFEELRAGLTEAAEAAGLRILAFVDVTPNLIDALEADGPRRERLIAKLPGFTQGYAREWSDLPGTERYMNYRRGLRVDFGLLLRR